jgi:transposase InsO family protein
VNPERRRRAVAKVRRRLGHDKVSERRACQALGQPRSTQRYAARRPDADRQLIAELRRLAESYPRHGSERMHELLVNTGWRVNFKRVHRLWKQEHMQVPTKQRKKRRLPGHSANGCVRYRSTHRNHVWSYDFVMDRTEDGRQLKLLVVIDEFTRECLAIEAARSFTARDVKLTLGYLFAVRGAPVHIRSDNGPEFVAGEIQKWLGQASVDTLYIQKASPWENGYVESFNSRLRDELLNRELFLGLDEARYVLDEWRNEYNHRRLHGGIGWKPPAAYAAMCDDKAVGACPATTMGADPPVGATPLPAAQHPSNNNPVLLH